MKAPQFDPAWPEDVRALYLHDLQEIWDPTVAPHIWNQYHNQLDLYRRLAGQKSPRRILDVGCAQATLALMLAEDGHQVWALDIRPQFLEYARSRHSHGRIHFVCANFLDAEFDAPFEILFANQILEHVVYPRPFLARCARLLNPGGLLVVTTPNGEYLKNPLPGFSELGDPSQHAHRQFSADGDGHFFAYRERELRSLFLEQGFQDVRSSFFETPFVSGHMKVRYLHGFVPSRLLRLFDRGVLGSRALGRRFGHQLLMTGRRVEGGQAT